MVVSVLIRLVSPLHYSPADGAVCTLPYPVLYKVAAVLRGLARRGYSSNVHRWSGKATAGVPRSYPRLMPYALCTAIAT